MNAFISVYALVVCLAVNGVLFHTLQIIDSRKDYVLALYFQKQAHLHSLTIKHIALACIRDNPRDFGSCQDAVDFGPYFRGHYTFGFQGDIILDIMVESIGFLSTHPLRYTRRYIVNVQATP